MDTRAARRAAEKAARDLTNSRAALVGELGVRHAELLRLRADVDDAAAAGRQLVANAQAQAARLLAAAQQLEQDGQQRYADAYTATTTGGWPAADLTALGFPPGQEPPANRDARTAGRRRPRTGSQPPTPTDQLDPATAVDIPEQPHHDPEPVPAAAP